MVKRDNGQNGHSLNGQTLHPSRIRPLAIYLTAGHPFDHWPSI